MAVDTFRRYIWLLETIDRLGYAEFDTIQSEWNRSSLNPHGEDLPKRTFRNHITAIADQLYIYIEYKSGYGYYISNPEDMYESRIKQWMISTLSTYNFLSDCNDMRDKILFEDVPSSQKHLPQILRCIRNGVSLSFMYQSHFSDAAHITEVEPYCLKLFNRRWYMVGRNTDINELRTYALERMSDLDETEHTFVIPEQFDGESYFSNQYGITADGKPETIVFKAIPLEAKYLRTLPLHHSQEEIETNEEYKGCMHDHICATVSDVYAGETLEHDFCDEVTEDGIYVEVTEDEPYCTCPVNRDSKVYVVQDGEVVYEEVLSEYGDEFESYFE